MAKASSVSCRVLIADSDAAERQRLTTVVEAAAAALDREIVVDQASDGTTAMALWSEHLPGLVVCEVLLDGLSGLALLRRMKSERTALPPVIFVTRLSRESDRYWGLRSGAHAYLAKPYDDEQLRTRVQTILDKGADAPPERPFP
ncbi:MAG: response regulator [Deltaproteobacteria bacterium]|nr:response regulator [Deltaproteobacteria bacterium]